eukprot:3141186-Prymnesium_polylepis.1
MTSTNHGQNEGRLGGRSRAERRSFVNRQWRSGQNEGRLQPLGCVIFRKPNQSNQHPVPGGCVRGGRQTESRP